MLRTVDTFSGAEYIITVNNGAELLSTCQLWKWAGQVLMDPFKVDIVVLKTSIVSSGDELIFFYYQTRTAVWMLLKVTENFVNPVWIINNVFFVISRSQNH